MKQIREIEVRGNHLLIPNHVGVYKEDMEEDLAFMTHKFTSPRSATGLRAYDQQLQKLSLLHENGNLDKAKQILCGYERQVLLKDRCSMNA